MNESPSQKEILFDLWEQALDGDEKALAEIHRLLYNDLFNYASHMLQDTSLAEDAVQEAFIKIWNKKKQVGPLKNVKAYFLVMIRRYNLNQLKSLRLRFLRISESYEPDISFSPEDMMVHREIDAEKSRKLQAMLNQLPRRQKEVIYLKYYDNLEYDEISQVMDINYQSVVNLAFKAIQALKKAAETL